MPPSSPASSPLGLSSTTDSALAPLARAARAHVKLIVAIAVVAVAATVGALSLRAPKYQTTAQVLVTPLVDAGSYAGLPVLTSSVDPTRALQTAVTILSSSEATQATARQLRLPVQTVEDEVVVEPQGESDVVTITVTDTDEARAVRLADTYTAQALAVRRRDIGQAVAGSIRDLQARQAAVDASNSAVSTELASELTDLQRIADGQDPNFSLLQRASDPVAVGLSSRVLVVLGLIAGLVLGLLAALVVEFLNRRVRDEDDVLALSGLPVLARVPPLPRGAQPATTPDMVPPRVREAFRSLQIQLEGGEVARKRSVMFTSPSIGDGKTTSTINFSLTLARAGLRVVLLDLDLRKPDLSRRLGAQADLMELFRSEATIDDVLSPVPGAPGLRVMSARAGHDITPLFEAIVRRIPDLVAQAERVADYVVIDTPPLGEVSDALRVASAVDDIALVVRPGNTDRDHLRHAEEMLDRTGHRPSGLIVVGGRDNDADVNYGYGSSGAVEIQDSWDRRGRAGSGGSAADVPAAAPGR